MRNKFTRFVWTVAFIWVVIFMVDLLAFGFASLAQTADAGHGVTEAARSGEGTVAASPGPTAIANQAPLQAAMALLIPLAIAFFKSRVDIPDKYRKWIPVVAPVLGELVASLATNMPHGSGALAGLAAVGVREIKDQHSPANSTEGNGANKGGNSNGIVTGMGIAFGLLLFCGALAGCAHLDAKGIYKGDKVAYDADAVIDGGYAVLDGFVQWHRANAAVVDVKWPEIAKFAKQVEDGEGDQWIDDALDLRDAYSKNPSAENRTKLQQAVSVLQTALAKVAVYQARLATAKPATAKPAAASPENGSQLPPLAEMVRKRDGTNFLGVFLGMIAERDGGLRKWDPEKQCACGEELPPGVQMFSATSGQLLRWIPFDEFKAVYVDRTRPEYQN